MLDILTAEDGREFVVKVSSGAGARMIDYHTGFFYDFMQLVVEGNLTKLFDKVGVIVDVVD